MPNLTDLTIKEGSFCPQGMNPQAKIMLFKMADGTPPPPLTAAELTPVLGDQAAPFLAKMEETARTFREIEGNREVQERINAKTWVLMDSIRSILEDPDADHTTMLQQSVAEFSAAVLAELPNLVTKAGRKISAPRLKQLRSALTALQAVIAEQEDESMDKATQARVDVALAALPEAHRGALAALEAADQKTLTDVLLVTADALDKSKADADALTKAQTELAAAQEQIATLEKAAETEPTDEDVLKSLPVAMQKRFADLEKQAADDRAVAKAERDARQLQDFTKQAETDLPNLPAEAGEKGRLLKVMAEHLEKADFDQVVTLLKAGSEALYQVLKISGRDTQLDANSAMARIEGVAAELRKADPTLTSQQALSKAIEANPALYGDHLKERQLSA